MAQRLLRAVQQVGPAEVCFAVGIGCLAYGLAGWSIPLAWTCVGALLVRLAWPRAAAGPGPTHRRNRGD